MFSLLSLYFAYRRDVVMAERYVAGLAEQGATVAPVAETVEQAPVEELLPLAA
jgi:hypothetical protein